MKFRFLFFVLTLLVLVVAPMSLAQETTPDAQDPPTEVPTETPLPTGVPTETPLPTDIPTETPLPETTPIVEPEGELTPEPEVTEEPLLEEEMTETPTVVAPETPTEADGNEFIVKYDPNASEEAIQAILQALNAVEVSRIPAIGALRVRLVTLDETTPRAAYDRVQASSNARIANVTGIEPLTPRYLTFTPNDARFNGSEQWGLYDFGSGGAFLRGDSGAWAIATQDGNGITVAVLDTGVQAAHPDLSGQVLAGWNFIDDNNNTNDIDGHGTHVAGVIAAKTNNAIGIAGIAFRSKILPVKVLDDLGFGDNFSVAAGIVYAVDKGAKVINLSLGSCLPSISEQAAVEYALSREVVVVASAGNDHTRCQPNPLLSSYFYPASYPGVISVAAHDVSGNSAGDTSNYNRNDKITLSAPGIDILSTYPNSTYAYLSGTSMAAPHVAGVAALVMADKVATTVAGVREALICGAFDRGVAGYDVRYGHGILQADWSMNWRSNSELCKVPILNDSFETPVRITKAPFTQTVAISSRSTTEQTVDPSFDLGAPPQKLKQTLWYRFVPSVTGTYLLSTFGSSYDTVLGVFSGGRGSFSQLGVNDDFTSGSLQSALTVSLQARVEYWIVIGTLGTPVNGILQFSMAQGLVGSTASTEESSPSFIYSGSWVKTAVAGASGGSTMNTADLNATLMFAVRNNNTLNLYRTLSPVMGVIQVYVNGTLFNTYSSNSAIQRANQVVNLTLGGGDFEWKIITLKRAPFVGNIDIDRIQVLDVVNTLPKAVVASRTDDASLNHFVYSGAWSTLGMVGALQNNFRQTSSADASVTFRANGPFITVFRNTGSAGLVDVYLNGALYTGFDNTGTVGVGVPFTFPVPDGQHVIRLVLTSGVFGFDGAISNSAVLPATGKVQESALSLSYTGIWQAVSQPLADGGTFRRHVGGVGSSIRFTASASNICVIYNTHPTGGTFSISVNGVSYGNTSTLSAGTTYRNRHCLNQSAGYNPLLTGARNLVQINVTGIVEFDAIEMVNFAILKPTQAYVTETNAGFFYFGSWVTSPSRSLGGYTAQGGSARRPVNGSSSMSFFIEGSGFVLYTSRGPLAGGWSVYVDGVLVEAINTLSSPRYSPIAVGITGLPPGNHYIELYPDLSPGEILDFDGIRVLPGGVSVNWPEGAPCYIYQLLHSGYSGSTVPLAPSYLDLNFDGVINASDSAIGNAKCNNASYAP